MSSDSDSSTLGRELDPDCDPFEVMIELQAVLGAAALMQGGVLVVPVAAQRQAAGLGISIVTDPATGDVLIAVKPTSIALHEIKGQVVPDQTHEAPAVLQ